MVLSLWSSGNPSVITIPISSPFIRSHTTFHVSPLSIDDNTPVLFAVYRAFLCSMIKFEFQGRLLVKSGCEGLILELISFHVDLSSESLYRPFLVVAYKSPRVVL